MPGAALNHALPGSVTLQPYGGDTPVRLPGLPASASITAASTAPTSTAASTTAPTASTTAPTSTAASTAATAATAAATAAAAGEESGAGDVNLAALRTAAFARTVQQRHA